MPPYAIRPCPSCGIGSTGDAPDDDLLGTLVSCPRVCTNPTTLIRHAAAGLLATAVLAAISGCGASGKPQSAAAAKSATSSVGASSASLSSCARTWNATDLATREAARVPDTGISGSQSVAVGVYTGHPEQVEGVNTENSAGPAIFSVHDGTCIVMQGAGLALFSNLMARSDPHKQFPRRRLDSSPTRRGLTRTRTPLSASIR
jgi:hypothetical protein